MLSKPLLEAITSLKVNIIMRYEFEWCSSPGCSLLRYGDSPLNSRGYLWKNIVSRNKTRKKKYGGKQNPTAVESSFTESKTVITSSFMSKSYSRETIPFCLLWISNLKPIFRFYPKYIFLLRLLVSWKKNKNKIIILRPSNDYVQCRWLYSAEIEALPSSEFVYRNG